MQIKFLTIYHALNNVEQNLIGAQMDLLDQWRSNLQISNLKFITKAEIAFKDYSFFDYPDQEKAKKYINSGYLSTYKNRVPEYWWAGIQYPDLDTLYEAIAKSSRFMELTIALEDY